MAVLRSGAHVAALNPVTSVRLVKTIIYPKALYGCELRILSKTELLLSERAQRYIAKSIQGLERRTRRDICNELLGWTFINILTLVLSEKKFLNETKNHKPPLQVKWSVPNGQYQIGLIPEFMRILNKYIKTQHINNFVDTGEFVCKATWKLMVKNTIHSYEEREWLLRMASDIDFYRFSKIQSNLEVNKLLICSPESRKEIQFVIQLLVTLRIKTDVEPCHKCGQLYTDTSVHITMSCMCTPKLTDSLWCHIITNIGDLMFSVYLHSLSDSDLFHVLAGTDIKFEISNEEEIEFRIKAVKCLYNSSTLYYSD